MHVDHDTAHVHSRTSARHLTCVLYDLEVAVARVAALGCEHTALGLSGQLHHDGDPGNLGDPGRRQRAMSPPSTGHSHAARPAHATPRHTRCVLGCTSMSIRPDKHDGSIRNLAGGTLGELLTLTQRPTDSRRLKRTEDEHPSSVGS